MNKIFIIVLNVFYKLNTKSLNKIIYRITDIRENLINLEINLKLEEIKWIIIINY